MNIILLMSLLACDTGKDDTNNGDDSGGDDTAAGECNTDNEECGPGVSGCGGEGSDMLPGADCLSCHTGEEDDRRARMPEEGPLFTAAGTVFSDLDGVDYADDVTVRITDSTGELVELTSSTKGNFHTSRTLVPPLSAEIETDAGVKTMGREVETGACNTCHSCDGEAGGKLYAP